MPTPHTAKPYARKVRVATLIQQTLSAYLRTKALDPRLHPLTITDVDCSPDLKHASITLHAEETDDAAEGLRAIQRAKPHLRHYLAQQLDLRTTPRLTFKLIPSHEGMDALQALLDQIPTPDESPSDADHATSDQSSDASDSHDSKTEG